MELPRISIVMPSFGQGQFIEESICSILKQEYARLEFIILDGGSTDETVKILKKYSKHLAYYHSKPDRGQTDALIQGFKMATGDLLVWINSDDVLMSNALKNIAQAYLEKPHGGIYDGNFVLIDQQSQLIRCKRHPKQSGWFGKHGFQILSPGWFFRRSIYEAVGGLNDAFNFAMDADLYFRMVMFGAEHIHLAKDLVGFRIHPNSKTGTQQDQFFSEAKKIANWLQEEHGVNYYALSNISDLWHEEFGRHYFPTIPVLYRAVQTINGNYFRMCVNTLRFRGRTLHAYEQNNQRYHIARLLRPSE